MKPQKQMEKPAAPVAEKAVKNDELVETATLEIVEETGVEDLL